MEADNITVSQFQEVVDSWLQTRKEIDAKKEAMKPLEERRDVLEAQIKNYMEATELDSFQGKLGKVTRVKKQYVNQPAPEGRRPFLDYLIKIGELDEVVTFHQGKLTSWLQNKKEELGFDFIAPGLDELKERIELRKG